MALQTNKVFSYAVRTKKYRCNSDTKYATEAKKRGTKYKHVAISYYDVIEEQGSDLNF
jgi:hypothetical protein